MADHAGDSLEARLRRLKAERDEADERYNEALTALDAALAPPVALPQAPYPIDEHQITALNEGWNILPAPPAASGLRGRLTGFVWGVVAPYLQRQLTFNSRLVDHINRHTAAARASHQAAEATIAALRQQLDGVLRVSVAADAVPPADHGLRRYEGSGLGGRGARAERVAQRAGREPGEAVGIAHRARAALRSADVLDCRVAGGAARDDRRRAAGDHGDQARDRASGRRSFRLLDRRSLGEGG